MFKKNIKEERPGLDRAIDRALNKLEEHEPDSPEHAKIMDSLERLYKLQLPAEEAAKPVSRDAILAAVANIAGIVLIIHSERVQVITSKALGFVAKPKL